MKSFSSLFAGKWYYLKKLIFLILLKLRKYKSKKQDNELRKEQGAGYGTRSKVKMDDMEMVQPLSDHSWVSLVVLF